MGPGVYCLFPSFPHLGPSRSHGPSSLRGQTGDGRQAGPWEWPFEASALETESGHRVPYPAPAQPLSSSPSSPPGQRQ